ncbi:MULTISPECIES: TetR/AcrR family transcriptional regulator [unclassified Streptomyces]|uniref:TetR/AcrR family transcriptional regulator n=1 Tax=unclassified Streptomyces TaxID=2593676 RepID=UPI0024424FC7|nr:TetR/AcrR family transcriptional regulator [Streptomyces sp. DH41]MDG9725793.1 TetR/AcrR family transcriptional regulator [Streptomyces sp. DH41]
MADETSSTRDRLLDAAEKLFLDHGVNQVSVRAINSEAGLNPGAAHYHFGSRDGLVAALLERELQPRWGDRLEELAETAVSDDSGPPEIDMTALVRALVEPFDDMVRSARGRVLCSLLAQTCLDADPPRLNVPWFGSAPFEVMLGRALPHLTVHEVADRWRLAFTLLLQLYGRPQAVGRAAAEPSFPAAETVVAFLAAGLTAPSPRR